MGDVRGLAGGNAVQRGQHTGVQPFRGQLRKGRQLLGPGGQQDIALRLGQKIRHMCRRLEHHAPGRQGTRCPQQPVIFHPGGAAGCADVAGGVHCIGVGGVYAQVGSLHKGGHLVRGQPAAVHRDAGKAALFLAAQRGGHAHQNVRPKLGQLPGKNAALGGAAEHHCPHTRYPRGVTMRPCSTRVLRLPMYTVVNISTGVCSSWASVST